MTTGKKVLAAAGAVVLLVLVALLVLPVLFKDRIAARARTALDEAVAAHVDWSGLGLTFFRDFPNLTLTVADLSVVPTAGDATPGDSLAAAADTLASVGDLRFVLDVGSVWRAWRGSGPLVVRSIRLDRPTLDLRVDEQGRANWDVMNRTGPETPSEGAPRAMSVELRSFEVSDGDVAFRNDSTGVAAHLVGLDYSLAGNFSQQRVVARTRAHADRTTVRFGGTSYLREVALDFEANVDADLEARHFTFQDNELRLNDLAVRFAGDVTRRDDALDVDVTFEAPRTEFGQALSLVPTLYATDFSSLQTSGNFTLSGEVKGTYAEGNYPAFSLKALVDQGMFRYPDLPLPARDISLDLAVDNPGGSLDATVVQLSRFHVVIGDQPVDAAVTVRTPVSDPDVDARVQGTLDLGAVARTVKLPDVQELAGVVTADAAIHARLSDVDAARYDRIDARGSIGAKDVALISPGLRQPVSVQELALDLSPSRADLKTFRAKLGSSDVQAHGSVENILAFIMRDDEPLRGSATFTSQRFVLDEWRSEDPALEVIPVPPMLDLALDGTIDTLTLGDLRMSDARGAVTVQDERLTMKDFTLNTLGGRVRFNGFYDTKEPARPTFDVALAVDSVDVSAAAANLLTVRTLAPVARYAKGTFSTDLKLNGALNPDFTPIFDVLSGAGLLTTSKIAIEGFPLLQKLAGAISLPRLSSPTFDAIRSSIEIHDGRLHVKPFRVGVGDFRMSVEGSNGIDQSLDYTLGLVLPRAALGDAADRVVQGLAAKAQQAGIDLRAADSIRIGIGVSGTVGSPELNVGLGEAAGSVRDQVTGAAGAAVDQKVDEAKERVDSTRAEALRRAQAQADSIVAEAERRAEQIRAEAKKLADQVRAEGDKRAEEVLAKATNPLAKRAAQPVADRIRKEAEDKAARMEQEAAERADALVAEARQRADDILAKAGGG